MRDQLEPFVRRVPDLDRMSTKELVAFFAFFLTEVAGDASVKPKRIRDCFEAALLVPPGNISAVMGKSKFFVPTKSGQQLQRAVRNRIAAVMGAVDGTASKAAVAAPQNGNVQPDPGTAPAPVAASVPGLSKNVMVVYGRNQPLRDSMFGFLRALKLNPIEWSEAVRATGKGSALRRRDPGRSVHDGAGDRRLAYARRACPASA